MFYIGNGKPEHAAWFREAVPAAADVPLYTDPKRASYAAAGMKRGVVSVLGPRALAGGVRAFLKGNRQTKTKGDPWQNGGVLVLDKKGKITWKHVSENAGEMADPDAVVAALKAK